MAFLGQAEQIREFQERFKYLYAAVFLGLGLLMTRMVYLQILRGEQMRQSSEDNRIKRVKIAAPRGMIFDRNHTLLIDNRPAFDLEITPQYLNESKKGPQVVSALSHILKMPTSEIQGILDKAKNQPTFLPVKIKNDLSRDEVALIEVWKLEMPGVDVKEEIKRTNIHGDVAAHLLGYISEVNSSELPQLNKRGFRYRLGDSIGKFGLEQRLEDTLRGGDGEELREVDAMGRIKLDRKNRNISQQFEVHPAVPGKNVVLTIDQDLQMAATQAFGEKIGAAVALDPRTGEVLAMISRPSFDPTEFSRGISTTIWNKLLNNENRPLRDKTIQDWYMPGSTFKPVTAAAALEEGVIDEHTHFTCTGNMKIGNRVIHCASRYGHGDVNVITALTQSCDIFFYKAAQRFKSVDDISKWAVKLGLGKKTGINLAREVQGLIPTEEWKRKRFNQVWNPGETASVAIGQSYVLATILQMANMYAYIGNGGQLWRPYIVKEVQDADGATIKEFKPDFLDSNSHLKPKTVELLKQGLWGAVNSPKGTAYSQRLPGMDFVGKTGTAQVIRFSAERIYSRCENMRIQDRHHGLFTGFAPVNDPKIAVAVIAEHSCHGASGAGPIARAIIKTYLEKYYPQIYGEKALAERLKTKGESLQVSRKATKQELEDEAPALDGVALPAATLPAEKPLPPPAPPMPVRPTERSDPVGPTDSSDDDGESGDED